LTDRSEIVVVGGGAVGTSCAYFLARAGRQVRLLERRELGSGSSHGNARFVPPSRSVPLSVPGVIARTLRAMRDPNAAFRLKPRLDRELAAWLWRFRTECNADTVDRTTRITLELIRRSLALYEELASQDGLEFGFRRNGLLELFRSDEGRARALHEAEFLRGHGVAFELLEAPAVRQLEPRINAEVAGGVLFPEDADVDPPRLVRELARRAEDAGAHVETGIEVVRLRQQGGTITQIETSRGTLTPELVVLANGAWATRTAATLGVRLLIQPAKGYGFALSADKDGGTLPLFFSETHTTLTPMASGSWVTGKLDLLGFDESSGGRRVAAIPDTARSYVDLGNVEVIERWFGYRPLTPDGLPIVGRHPAVQNLIFAVGHGRLGIALAPVTGQLVTELASGEVPSLDLEPLRPDRFERRRA
jgi:D-amino-acid dehydrogenase